MSQELQVVVSSIESQVFAESSAVMVLSDLRDRYCNITTIKSTGDYDLVRSGIAECRKLRVAIEDRRKELKRDIIDAGKIIDGEASRLESLVREIEQPLAALKQASDEEKAKAKREKEEAERLEAEERLKAKMEKERQELEAQRAEIERAKQDSLYILRKQQEAMRIEDEKRQAELRKQQEEMRVAEEARQAELRRVQEEQRRIAAELEADREKLESEKRAQQQAAEMERQRKLDEERKEQERLQAIKAHRLRVEAMPEWERYGAYIQSLINVPVPEINGEPQSRVAVVQASLQREKRTADANSRAAAVDPLDTEQRNMLDR